MLPLYDTIKSRSYPIVTVSLIVINVAVFIVPAQFSESDITLKEKFLPFLTSIFIHGGWFHVIFNMWFLWIFGDNVEDRLGHVRYFLFYIVCGVAAGFVHFLTKYNSALPTVGASGAIAGVMGAYLILFPLARVVVLVPIFFFPFFFEMPAFFFLAFWFFMQFYGGYVDLLGLSGDFRGIAWWAHAGGFVIGMITVKFLLKEKRSTWFGSH